MIRILGPISRYFNMKEPICHKLPAAENPSSLVFLRTTMSSTMSPNFCTTTRGLVAVKCPSERLPSFLFHLTVSAPTLLLLILLFCLCCLALQGWRCREKDPTDPKLAGNPPLASGAVPSVPNLLLHALCVLQQEHQKDYITNILLVASFNGDKKLHLS